MPGSAFASFVKARFPAMPDIEITDPAAYNSATVKVLSLSEEWRLASDTEKQPYEEAAKAAAVRYHADMEVLRDEVAEEKVVKDTEREAALLVERAKKASANREYRRRKAEAAAAE